MWRLLASISALFLAAGCTQEAPAVHAIHSLELHRVEKIALHGTAALYSGWTIDDATEVTMLYADQNQACALDISGTLLLAKYDVKRDDGKRVSAWQLQPNATDAGCMLSFASFRGYSEKDGHEE